MRGIRLLDGTSLEVARVIQSVLPVFTHESERPEHIGSCVLTRIDGRAFVVTAAHVLEAIQAVSGHFTVGVGGRTVAIHGSRFISPTDHPADVGLIPLFEGVAQAIITEEEGAFLDAEMLDQDERGDGTDIVNTGVNRYFIVGFPASGAQSRINRAQKTIRVKAYTANLVLAPTRDYPAGLSPDHHLLLDYDTARMRRGGKPVNPPAVFGMSGGGVFRARRNRPDTTKLVGILIETHKAKKVLAATRLGVVAAIARGVIAEHPDVFANSL